MCQQKFWILVPREAVLLTTHREHRQRKENYVKHLEQDVINLREMIAREETQAVLFNHENEAIKSTLLSSSIPVPTIPPVTSSVSGQHFNIIIPTNLPEQHPQSDFKVSGSPQNSQWQSSTSSSGSVVSMTFDEMIDASCLQITSPSNFIPDIEISMTSPDIFNLPPNPYAEPTPPPSFPLNPQLSKALPKLPDEATAPVSQAVLKDLSAIAINFILACAFLSLIIYFSSTLSLLTLPIGSSTPAELTSTPTTQPLTPKVLPQAMN
jgi:hypothetical protein